MKKVILASQSPRRRELMAMLEIPFVVEAPMGEEYFDERLSIVKQIEKIAENKAHAVFENNPDALIIGSDTVVVYEGEIFGKPKEEAVAIDMLRKLSGAVHEVVTAVCMKSDKTERIFSTTTRVRFMELSDDVIARYVASKEPLDRAGAYSIQGKAALFVEAIEGDYYAVMGLPIAKINYELTHNEW